MSCCILQPWTCCCQETRNHNDMILTILDSVLSLLTHNVVGGCVVVEQLRTSASAAILQTVLHFFHMFASPDVRS